jgi:carboxymethylenebutenolidase
MPMNTRLKVQGPGGAAFDAYLTMQDATKRPGLLICTEVFGVNSHMRAVADRFAAAGYVVLVPDLFWRIEPGMEIPYDEAGLKRGSEIVAAFDVDRGVEDLGSALKALRQRPECSGKVGVVGFCVGGALAYLAAARLGVDAAVSYYGKGIEERLPEAAKIACPLMLHYGGADRFIPEAVVDRVEAALSAKPNVEIFRYPGVDHGFNSEDRRAYNPELAARAMQRTLRLLDGALKR